MKNIKIDQLGDVTFATIHEAFRKAFADYVEPFSLSEEQLQYMLERRGCDLNLSFGAFYQDELVGFILNGVGQWNGKKTAYDTGTGTIKEFRKKGIATKIFDDSLDILRGNQIEQYLLEVIKTNSSAVELYQKAGFEVSREFDYYVAPKSEMKFRQYRLNDEYQVVKLEIPDWELFTSFCDFQPSWQNSIDSINQKIDHFTFLGLVDYQNIIGYGLIEKHTGDIPQIAIKKSYRGKGLATTLVKKLIWQSNSDKIQIINADADYEPFKRFAKSINLEPGHGQYEMVLAL